MIEVATWSVFHDPPAAATPIRPLAPNDVRQAGERLRSPELFEEPVATPDGRHGSVVKETLLWETRSTRWVESWERRS